MIDIINHVPFGECNALSARQIWNRVGCGSVVEIQRALDRLADDQAIRRHVVITEISSCLFYWRDHDKIGGGNGSC